MVQVQSNAPSVNCFITKNKSRLKIYKTKEKETVYLNDKDNFEIELSNMKKNRVLCKIYINNKLITESGLVINPGQTNFLERFIENSVKFQFETYKVEAGNTAVDEAISDNGIIKIEFYDESIIIYNSNYITTGYNYWYNYNPTIFTSNLENFTLTTSNYHHTYNPSVNLTSSNIEKPEEKETGIVSQGGQSNQSITTTFGNFDYSPFLTKTFQILPISVKPVEFKEIRNYCSGCGYRLRQDSWKFCPKCGGKL